ncbi:MAG: hypothetical protein K9H64_03355 [Bacteroidales bacterium]|nr:hypothetical protein [Bacteroidales bacterium]MCF8456458.1 hypothetical protein [Bacteroidales bacterium]
MIINEAEIVNARQRWISFANSLTFFLLAFVVVYMVNLLATYITAESFGVDAVIKYFKVDFKINNESDKWTVDSLILIFYMSPFVSLLLAGLFSRLKNLFRPDPGYFKLFLMWGFIHSMNFCFASFIGGVATEQGIWFALAWMGVPTFVQIIFAVVFAILLYFIGSTSSVYFLECCNYPFANNPVNRQYWLLNAGLKTWFAGFLIVGLLFLPEIRYYELIIYFSMIIIIIPFFHTSKLMTEVMIVEEVEKPVFHWKWLAVALLCLVLIRILLS